MTFEVTTADGGQERGFRPFTSADQAAVDDDIDAYLEDAGLPARPRGFSWYLRTPPHIRPSARFWGRLNGALAVEAPTARYPTEVRQAVEVVLPRILHHPAATST